MNPSTITFYTLGCRLNQSETAVIIQTFEKDPDFCIVTTQEPSDIAVINTCTVTKNGDNDTRKLINKIIRKNKKVKIALIGCQSQIQKDTLSSLPNVCWIVGTQPKMDLLAIIKDQDQNNDIKIMVPEISEKSFTMPEIGIDREHTRANLKIQDGCNFFCSFCEIPYARGRARSRDFNDILKAATSLTSEGFKEIVITGINVGCYKFNNYSFLDVINALEQITNLKRIRLSSIEPTTIDTALLQKMNKDSKLCRYMHIPLQSADNGILKAMNRRYTREEYAYFINQAHDHVEELCLGTDVIVGFPGEDEQAFLNTKNFLTQLPLSYMHVFSYSKRHKARARHLSDEVTNDDIQKRSKILRDLSLEKKIDFMQRMINTTQDVLFEEKKNQYWSGLTDNYLRIFTPSNKDLSNKFFPVQLTQCTDNKLFAKLI